MPVVATLLLLATALVARSPLQALGSGAPIAMRLHLPVSYLALAPFCGVLDALSLLSLRQHIATMVTIMLGCLALHVARTRSEACGLKSGILRALGVTVLLLASLVALYAVMTLVPRPMAALALGDPDGVVVDFHSHTSASHDGNQIFGARESRAWHRAAGFDVGYLSDHGTFAGFAAADSSNPVRAGDGTMLLRALEVRCEGEHLVLLGPVSSPTADCDAARADPRVIAILTIPGDLDRSESLPFVQAIEIADGAPRALDQMARDAQRMRANAANGGLAEIAGSNNHGWTRTSAAWTIVPVRGWRSLDAAALDAAIRARIALGARSGIRVVERRRVAPPAGVIGLAATVPLAGWVLLRDLSPAERASWIGWCWLAWCVGAAVRRRPMRARDSGVVEMMR